MNVFCYCKLSPKGKVTMKVSIITDLEGPCGVYGKSDGIGNAIGNPATAAQALVNEVNAVCRGLVSAGVDEIVVLDGHGAGNSIDIFKLHPKAHLMQFGFLGPIGFFDASYDAVIQLGTHAMQNSNGYLCHTFNSHGYTELKLNGKLIGEIGICSLLAAYFKLPTILVSGDDVACCEAREFLGDKVELVPTKASINRYSAVNYPPQEVYAQLELAARSAIEHLNEIPVPEIPENIEMTLQLMCPNQARSFAIAGNEQIDERTLRFTGKDFVDIWAQCNGYAPEVHNRTYGISPDWILPHPLAEDAFREFAAKY
jgi:D-amino peptidase